MARVSILVVSYGSREVAMIDAFKRSTSYETELYIVDKQRNPFNIKRAQEHVVVPDFDLQEIAKFVNKRKDKIDFGIVGPEKPIVEGVRDVVENLTHVPIICPTRDYAIEASKVAQRRLLDKVAPEANPKFKIFKPADYRSLATLRKDVYAWLNTLKNEAVVKPDKPAAGKGVGVWGDHFNAREQLFDHFAANFQHGAVIIEEKVEGEESSFQAFCDGKHLVSLPETRDYKRAFDGDHGPNTGGMGSYKNTGEILPFMTADDREKEIGLVDRLFRELRKKADSTDLRGIPFYDAFIHTGKGPKILENNSRPGDPEIQCLLPILKDDFVDICYKILEGNLTKVSLEKQASVATYKAPPSYGGYASAFPSRINKAEVGAPLDLREAHRLCTRHRDNLRVYPGSMEIRDDGNTYSLSSRTVCVVGIGKSIEEARELSLEGLKAIKGGALWNRNDIASKEHIARSIEHMNRLRIQN